MFANKSTGSMQTTAHRILIVTKARTECQRPMVARRSLGEWVISNLFHSLCQQPPATNLASWLGNIHFDIVTGGYNMVANHLHAFVTGGLKETVPVSTFPLKPDLHWKC